jgi:aspartokinase-like uncharacterized kinase
LGGAEAELFSIRDARQLIRQIDQQLHKTIAIPGKVLFANKVRAEAEHFSIRDVRQLIRQDD